jgi:hypothetical protein
VSHARSCKSALFRKTAAAAAPRTLCVCFCALQPPPAARRCRPSSPSSSPPSRIIENPKNSKPKQKGAYARPDELWERTKGGDGTHQEWYSGAVEYWDKQEASYNGVLGGFGHVSGFDVADSRDLLKKVFKRQLKQAADGARALVAVDCGAGVGRVTQELLLHHFQTVDVLEPSRHLIAKAQRSLKLAVAGRNYPEGHAPGEFLCRGLQEFEPAAGRYDCVWVQWCLLYLTDGARVLKAGMPSKGGGSFANAPPTLYATN